MPNCRLQIFPLIVLDFVIVLTYPKTAREFEVQPQLAVGTHCVVPFTVPWYQIELS